MNNKRKVRVDMNIMLTRVLGCRCELIRLDGNILYYMKYTFTFCAKTYKMISNERSCVVSMHSFLDMTYDWLESEEKYDFNLRFPSLSKEANLTKSEKVMIVFSEEFPLNGITNNQEHR